MYIYTSQYFNEIIRQLKLLAFRDIVQCELFSLNVLSTWHTYSICKLNVNLHVG